MTTSTGSRLGEIGLVCGHLGGELGIAAGLFDRVAEEGSQAASAGGDDEQRLAQVRDLDRPPAGQVPAASCLSRQGHLASIGYSELGDVHDAMLLLTRWEYKYAL